MDVEDPDWTAQIYWFSMHTLPPLFGALLVLFVVRHDPSTIVKTLPSLVPGLTEPKLLKATKNRAVSWQLTFHADILDVFTAVRATRVAYQHVEAHEKRAKVGMMTSSDLRDDESNLSAECATVFREGSPRNTAASWNPLVDEQDEAKRTIFSSSEAITPPKTVYFQDARGPGQPHPDRLADALRRSCSMLVADGRPKERVIINFAHMWRLSIIPVLFCMYYFWDGAVIRKYVSKDFPLSHCHEEYSCFFTRDFSFFGARFFPLKCGELRERSIATGDFKFRLPKGAEFFECYEIAFTVTTVIQYTCDCVSLFVFFTLVTAYFMVTRVSETEEDDSEPDIGSLLQMSSQQLAAERVDTYNARNPRNLAILNRRIRYYIRCEILSLMVLLGCIALVCTLVGKVFFTTGSCVVLPSAALYIFFLFDIKRESLQDYRASLEAEKENEVGTYNEKTPLCASSDSTSICARRTTAGESGSEVRTDINGEHLPGLKNW